MTAHDRAKQVFLDAIAQPRGARPAFVSAACAGDEELRREVESLLAFHDDSGSPGGRSTGPLPASPRIVQHARRGTDRADRSWPQHLVHRAARRLQLVCWVATAVVVVLWGLVNLIQGEFGDEFVFVWQWMPPISVLAVSLAMLAAARWGLAPRALVRAGLVYQVLVSFATAVTQYAGAFRGVPASAMDGDRVGLSHVATWMLMFTVLVPARPAETAIALVASAASVPLVYWQQMRSGLAPSLDAVSFTSLFVWPYAVVAAASYVVARIVHQLGVEVRRADELGGYRLEALIGHGGMGDVWRASHHTLARPAAIKVVRRELLGTDAIQAASIFLRFEAEAQVIASLECPHTIGLYDFGRTEEGTIFYVMELLDGVDLDRLVRRDGPLPPARAVHILRQVCDSLAEAHHRGLVHRDVKPANIYLCRRGLEFDFVKVLDFGLATAFADAAASAPPRGGLIGTPDFMAPESTAPGGAVDGRSDLYALGGVAFWLLTGRVVFPAETLADLLEAHRATEPIGPASLSPETPPALDRLVIECLDKSPARRPQSASELLARLEAIALTLPWSAADAAAWWSRHASERAEGDNDS